MALLVKQGLPVPPDVAATLDRERRWPLVGVHSTIAKRGW
jgi:hypothetical protein